MLCTWSPRYRLPMRMETEGSNRVATLESSQPHAACEAAAGVGHDLHQSPRPGSGYGVFVEETLLPDDGQNQVRIQIGLPARLDRLRFQ